MRVSAIRSVFASAAARRTPVALACLAIIAVALSFSAWSCSTLGIGRQKITRLPSEPAIRVRVARESTAAAVDGPPRIVVSSMGGVQIVKAPVQVSFDGSALAVAAGGGESFSFDLGADRVDLVAVAPTRGTVSLINLDGVPYPGRLRFVHSAETPGTMDVINVAPMEAYVAGVVSKELYSKWALPAFCAQAVCARTYALFQRQRALSSARPWDVENTTADQVYPGWTDLQVAHDAARETAGVVLTYRGRGLKTYYSSTCGGRQAAAADAFPSGRGFEYNKYPPLQAHQRDHACQQSPLYRWKVTRSTHELSQRIRTWGEANKMSIARLGMIRAIRIKKVNALNRPVRFEIEDDKRRTWTLGAEDFRVACNRSVPGLNDIVRENRLHAADVDVAVFGDKVEFEGRGFGHGVGMCQFCAKCFADAGVPWESMLETFYPGATLDKLY